MNKILSIKEYSWESSPDMERDIVEVIDDSNILMNDDGEFNGTIRVTVEYIADHKADLKFYLSEYRSGVANRTGQCEKRSINTFSQCSRPDRHDYDHAAIMMDDNNNLHVIAIWKDNE